MMRIKWSIELDRKKCTATIYTSDNQLVSSIKGETTDEVVNSLRDEMNRQIRNRYGEGFGHELQRSKEIGDRIFEIPAIIYKSDLPTPTKKKPTVEVTFGRLLPASTGYYWASTDKRKPFIVLVVESEDKDNFDVIQMGSNLRQDIVDFAESKKNLLWSTTRIPKPTEIREKEAITVDHEEW